MFCGSREISEPGRKLLVQWSNKAGAKQGIHKLRRGHRGGNVLHRAIPCCTRFLCGSSAALARDSDAHSNAPISSKPCDNKTKIGRATCREECVSTCRSRWSPDHKKTKEQKNK